MKTKALLTLPDATTPRYLAKPEAARLFGVSPRTLDSWMSRRLVPFYRIGRTIRFDPDDIQKHLQGNHRVGGAA